MNITKEQAHAMLAWFHYYSFETSPDSKEYRIAAQLALVADYPAKEVQRYLALADLEESFK